MSLCCQPQANAAAAAAVGDDDGSDCDGGAADNCDCDGNMGFFISVFDYLPLLILVHR